MKLILSHIFLFLFVFELNAKDHFTINGKIFSEQEYVLRTKDHQYSIKPNKSGFFEIDVKYDEFPFYYTVHSVSKKRKYSKKSPVVWIENDSAKPTLEIKEEGLRLNNKSEIQKFSERIENARRKDKIKIIKGNLDQIPALYFLNQEKENISVKELEQILQQIPSENQNHIYVKRTNAYYEAIKIEKLKKGSRLESFSLIDESGKKHDIMSNTNKTKIIAVLSSGCSYSLASISLLEQVEDNRTDNIEVFSIWDQQSEPWEVDKLQQKEKIVWTNLWDQYSFAHHYLRVKAHPTFYVVSPEGILEDRFGGYSKRTAKKFAKLLKEK